jgi:hypothetical protein
MADLEKAKSTIEHLMERLDHHRNLLSSMTREDINYLRGRLDLLEYLLIQRGGTRIEPFKRMSILPCKICGTQPLPVTVYKHRDGEWYCGLASTSHWNNLPYRNARRRVQSLPGAEEMRRVIVESPYRGANKPSASVTSATSSDASAIASCGARAPTLRMDCCRGRSRRIERKNVVLVLRRDMLGGKLLISLYSIRLWCIKWNGSRYATM